MSFSIQCASKAVFLLAVLAALAFVPPSPAQARDLGGVDMPDALETGGPTLILNGAGFRKKLFFKLYACGLYLEEKSSDPRSIIEADAPMAIRMHVVFPKISRKAMVKRLERGFEISTGGNTAPIRESMDAIYRAMPEKLRPDDTVDLVYTPGKGVACVINGKVGSWSPGLDFKKACFAIWLGPEPMEEKLKQKLLGLEP